MPTTLPGTGKVISSDPLNAATGLNGIAPAAGEEVQRAKITFGTNGFSRDVDAANGLPVLLSAESTKVIGTVNVGTTGGLALDATLTAGALVSQIRAATLIVSTTGLAAAAVTLTLPAVAGQFHYITRINILKYASAAVVGAATPVVVTTTNLAGALAWTTPTAQAIGTQYETDVQPASPIKSAVANTATTIVCPATVGILWRVNVYYYTAV